MSETDPFVSRINRVAGQVVAIKNMYLAKKTCSEVIQQIQAARAALGKLAGLLLTDEARKCAEEGKMKELEIVVEKTFKTI